MAVDLHLHTHHSDGNWSPSRVVIRAIELELDSIAITDHDTTAGIAEARQQADGRIEIVAGIELNTVYQDRSGMQSDVHILGYFIAPDHPAIKEVIKVQQEARLKLVADTIESLREHGYELSYEQVLESAGAGSIGRPHITQSIVKMGYAKNVSEAYGKFMQRNSPYYVPRNSISPDQAINAIKAAGGVSSIAHPGRPKHIKDIILDLKDQGLDAIEAYHRRHNSETTRHYIRFAAESGMGITGGSDCHGPWQDHPASIGTPEVPSEVLKDLKLLRSKSICGSVSSRP